MSYEVKSEHVDGVEVAHDIGRDVNEVYKTLVTQGVSKNIYVYVIPVHSLPFYKIRTLYTVLNILYYFNIVL